jgi:FMN-dependent NADH-azoreductase
MATVLHIDSSPLGELSVSRKLTADIVAAWLKSHPSDKLVYRDVAAAPPEHLTLELMQVVKFGNTEGLSPRQAQELALVNTLVDELFAADVIVIGAPMYNFSLPTQLKAYLDRLCQAGKTFKYTEKGPVGLVTGKKVIVASTRGGVYSTSEIGRSLDHQESYLRTVLAFIGITDVSFVRAEGVSMGPEAKDKALAAAAEEIAKLTAA